MSGRRSDREPGGNPLGDKIKEELLSALRLVFKTVEQHAVDVVLACDYTSFITELPCAEQVVAVNPPLPQLSRDVMESAGFSDIPTRTLQMIEAVGLSQSAPCEWQTVLCSEPVFDPLSFDPLEVSFDNLHPANAKVWPIEEIAARGKSKPIGEVQTPSVKDKSVSQAFATKIHSLGDHQPKVTVRNNPRYYALPIRKTSIPPHRFSAEAREQFRQALADKAGTHPGNVQLKMIYERMNVSLFSAIQVDESGHLMCTPKSELIGRNAMSQSAKARDRQILAGSEASYLVLGVRLDTKADIRALVPVEVVMKPADDDGLGA